MMVGYRSASVIASALVNVQTSFCVGPRLIGTYTCTPFDPLVFGYEGISSMSSAWRTSSDASSTCSNGAPGAGIEIEMKIIRPIDIVAARVPLVEVDAAEVDHPQQRGDILNHREIDDVARVVRDRAGLQPRGRGDGVRFMKKNSP